LALPDKLASVRADRTLEARPGAARVRFIDGASDYQTGSVVIRAAGEGGGLDLDLPAVCSRAVAKAAAARALETGREDRLTVALGPLDALALEPGDAVLVEDDSRDWRVLRLDVDETPSAVLEPVSTVGVGENDDEPSTGEPAPVTGAPFLRLLDLPPLLGAETDGRPIAAVAAEPWRPVRVFAGPDATSLTTRGDIDESATVGVLTAALSPGVRYRWDETNVIEIRIEGRAPESLSPRAVLAGGNALALETAAGWEVIQFRSAELVGGDVWRLSGLLRGQQGTDEATAAGGESGAIVVFLASGVPRVESSSAERGLPLIWRAGPVGSPAGGSGVSEISFTPTGRHDRPWSPAHLRRALRVDGGFDLTWRARSRLDGDRWDGEAQRSEPSRYRVRVLDGGTEIRVFEVETETAEYADIQVTTDFPAGVAGAEVRVAQWGEGYGWGAEARINLI
jgi:hypothetical protein